MSSAWVTAAQAAELVGCHPRTVEHYVKVGRIERRSPSTRGVPSLSRSSVEEFAHWWHDRVEAARSRRQRKERARVQAGPPTDGDIWLDATTVSLILSCTPQAVLRMAAQERLPAVRRGRRWYFRRRDVEVAAAARAWRTRTADRKRTA